jgi:hypothetical protein
MAEQNIQNAAKAAVGQTGRRETAEQKRRIQERIARDQEIDRQSREDIGNYMVKLFAGGPQGPGS